jgi:glutamyl-tRNA(Gln) amidotransferase subunit E
MAVGLAGFKGLLSFPLQPGRDFASEISDRVRVVACLDELPNIIHSEMMDSPLTASEWKRIGSAVKAKKEDVVVLVWGDVRDAATAVGEIVIRAREAAEGIPNETRQAFPSGINGFERILPGPDRMYPDTDMPPVPLADERIEETRRRLPLTPWQRRENYRRLGLSSELIEDLIKDGRAALFERVTEALPIRPTIPAVIISQTLKHLQRKGFQVSRLDDEALAELFGRFARRDFAREVFPDILKLAATEDRPVSEVIARLGIFRLEDDDIRTITGIVANVERSLDPLDPEKKFRYLMGVLMAELRGRAAGGKVAAALREAMGKDR